MTARPPKLRAVGAVLAVAAALAGCAQFPEERTGAFREQPSLQPQAGPAPSVEGEPPPLSGPAAPPPEPPKPTGPCDDPDPSVIATCLNPVGAIAPLPDGRSAVVAERATGRILRITRGSPPRQIARIPADPSGGGGVTGLALSPHFAEDQLLYAYTSTGGGNAVYRIAPRDRPKPVLTGIPRGPSGNGGAMAQDGQGALLVATGDAGSAQLATDPRSLAGKVLRIDGFGHPAPDNPTPSSPVVTAGLAQPGGLCTAPGSGTYWVTDRGGERDSLYRTGPDQPLSPAWSWPEKPGVAGCAVTRSQVVVALSGASALYTLTPTAEGGFAGQPAKVLENSYGRFSAATRSTSGLVWLGTSNKAGGRPIASDDRVLRLLPPSGGAAGKE